MERENFGASIFQHKRGFFAPRATTNAGVAVRFAVKEKKVHFTLLKL